MTQIKFNVFGHTRVVRLSNDQWLLLKPNGAGLLTQVNDVVIPDGLSEAELAGYLADIYHEWANDKYPNVVVEQ